MIDCLSGVRVSFIVVVAQSLERGVLEERLFLIYKAQLREGVIRKSLGSSPKSSFAEGLFQRAFLVLRFVVDCIQVYKLIVFL